MLLVALIICLIVLPNDAQLNGVFLFGKHFETFTFNCRAGIFAAITPDGKGMSFYAVTEEIFMVTYNYSHHPGVMIGIPEIGNRVVVAHNTTYMTILDSGYLTTDYIPAQNPSSLILVGDLACLLPSVLTDDGKAVITCMNLSISESKECVFDKHLSLKSHGYVNKVKNWVYVLNRNLTTPRGEQYILKYTVKNGCLVFQRQSPIQYPFGDHAWFSADGSSIFLENGNILISSDTSDDMTIRGSFNPPGVTNHFMSFSQAGDTKHKYVVALREDVKDTLTLYSWPSVAIEKEIKIPLSKKVKSVEPHSVYYCTGYNGLMLVFGQFQLSSDKIETGVAFINLID